MAFDNYYNPMDREYSNRPEADIYRSVAPIEKEINVEPVMSIKELGMTITEGQQGNLKQTLQGAIWQGTSKVELAFSGRGMPSTGAEAYGHDVREEMRDLAKINEVEISSVHTPPEQVGNLSGFNPQHGFSYEQRRRDLEEVKKAVRFAADVAQGGAVVVHTGEYPRPLTDLRWEKLVDQDGKPKLDQNGNERYNFAGYAEEPQMAITYMVDDRTGQVLASVRKNQEVVVPKYYTAKEYFDEFKGGFNGSIKDPKTGRYLKEEDYVDINGNYLKPDDPEDMFRRYPKWDKEHTRFETEKRGWKYFEAEAKKWNAEHPDQQRTPEEEFYRTQMNNQVLQYKGSSLFYANRYEQERDEYLMLSKSLPYWKENAESFNKRLMSAKTEEEKIKLISELPDEARYAFQKFKGMIDPREIEGTINILNNSIKHIHEASSAADAQAAQVQESLDHVKPVSTYAMGESLKSFAEAGIEAMRETHDHELKRDVFIAPENIFPEMGYGSHPQELIELVQSARKKMVEFLTANEIEDPSGRRDLNGHIVRIVNPYKDPSMDVEKAKKEAESHIKATLDTQHLGMWYQHFQREPNESEEQRRERFDKWYGKQIEKLNESGILGHVHVVDSMGSGHHHLPAGQGDIPVIDAVTYLKKHGFKGSMVSEGFEEGATRQLTETWAAFGTKIYGSARPGAPQRFQDIQNSYFGNVRSPYYIFGSYAPSNDWTLWSQVPLE